MAGIFPSDAANGVPPGEATNGFSPTIPPIGCSPRYFSPECETTPEAAVVNALISEILCAVDKLGFPYNCAKVCNLGEALAEVIANLTARLDGLTSLPASAITLSPAVLAATNVQDALQALSQPGSVGIIAHAPLIGAGTTTSPLDIANATDTTRGVLRIATPAEANAGSSFDTIVTPLTLKAAITAAGVGASATAIVTIAETPPVGPIFGQLWFDSIGGVTYVWYPDPDSTQWVPVVPGGGAGPSLPLTGGVMTGAITLPGNAVAPLQAVPLQQVQALLAAVAMPIGVEEDFAGITPPAGWLLEFGQAISRTTYAALFAALSKVVTGTTANASTTITAVSESLVGLGLEGAVVEAAGVPVGTTVAAVSSNTITLSAQATAAATGVAIRLLPWGRGDGSTTFTIPDRRGVVNVARDNMGGTAAGRMSIAGTGAPNVDASRLGSTGGTDRHTLVTAQMPGHQHMPQQAGIGFALNAGAAGRRLTFLTDGASPDIFTTITGGDAAHPNVQPSGTTNRIIYAGV